MISSPPENREHLCAADPSCINASGGRWDRPELHRLLDQLRKGDVLVVWKLDRLSRSFRDVLTIMERLASFNDVFKLVLSSQTNLEINLMGNGACRAHLTLVDARGEKLEGDMGGTRYPSTIDRKLNPGTYFIWAGTFRPSEVCSYTLTVGTKR